MSRDNPFPEMINTRVPLGTRSRLVDLAAAEGSDMSTVLRRLLLLALDKEERTRRVKEPAA